MDYEQIEVSDEDDVRVLTLSRPDKLNAWTPRMSAELVDAINQGNESDHIGAFVVTGAGRAFCAGADIGAVFASQLETSDDADEDRPPQTDWVALVRESKPIVAAINGPSIGVGLTLALPMDFLVAHPQAKLSARFVKMGLVPELASSHFLVQRCGWGQASDLALSGRTVLGPEALQMGLVDELADDVVGAAMARARSYAENAPPAVRATKALLTANGADTDLSGVQRRELRALNEAYTTPEHREAVQAFLEKRAPRFRS